MRLRIDSISIFWANLGFIISINCSIIFTITRTYWLIILDISHKFRMRVIICLICSILLLLLLLLCFKWTLKPRSILREISSLIRGQFCWPFKMHLRGWFRSMLCIYFIIRMIYSGNFWILRLNCKRSLLIQSTLWKVIVIIYTIITNFSISYALVTILKKV